MRGVNKVIVVGALGADPDVRYSAVGNAVTTISVATDEAWTDKTTGQTHKRTEWHRIVLFKRLAEIAAEYLRKGSPVYIEGSIRTEKYQDRQTGQDRYSTQIVARDLQLLGARTSGAGQAARPSASASDTNTSAVAGAVADEVPFARSELERLP